MRIRTVVIAIALGVSLGGPAGAVPTVRLSWDACTSAINRSRLAGSPATIVVTAIGFDQPVTGVDVRIVIGSQFTDVPDAWRFDAAGCAAGGFRTPESAGGKTCPSLSAPNMSSLTQVTHESGREIFAYANIHDPIAVNTATRYTIAKFEFDHSRSSLGIRPDSCSCIEQPMCIVMVRASWFGADRTEQPFFVQQDFLNWEDPAGIVGCPNGCDLCPTIPPPLPNPCSNPPTATQARSWGVLKASYR